MKKSLALSLLSLAGLVAMTTTPVNAALTINNSASTAGNWVNNMAGPSKADRNKANQSVHLHSPRFQSEKDSQQQVPTDTSLVKLLEVMRMAEMMRSITGTQNDMMESIVETAFQDKDLDDLTEQQKQQMINVVTDYSKQIAAETHKQLLSVAEKHFLTVAKKHYNQAEVDAQIAFYSSDIGQSILDKQPKLMQEYMMAIMPEILAVTKKVRDRFMPKMEHDLKEVLK